MHGSASKPNTLNNRIFVPSFESAPRKKKSQSDKTAIAVPSPVARSFAVLRLTNRFLSCSNTVYWITGLTTKISEGPRPRQRPLSELI